MENIQGQPERDRSQHRSSSRGARLELTDSPLQPPHSSPKIHFMLHTQVRIKQRQPSSQEPGLLHPTHQKARRSRQNRFLKQQQARSRGHNPRQGGRAQFNSHHQKEQGKNTTKAREAQEWKWEVQRGNENTRAQRQNGGGAGEPNYAGKPIISAGNGYKQSSPFWCLNTCRAARIVDKQQTSISPSGTASSGIPQRVRVPVEAGEREARKCSHSLH